ncbi:hypothetical protein FB107DRAFT_223786 [Schizophyllum commune]
MLIGPLRSVTPDDAAELTFKTSDGASFSVEQRNLWGTTDFVFKESSPGIIEVEEGADTLKILLEFVQPRRTPLLDDVSFDNLRAVAEAAEKYHIFSAMAIAHIRMSAAHKEHPLEVMSYAFRHGYTELLDRAAPLSVGQPASVVFKALACPPLFVAWAQYADAFRQIPPIKSEIQPADDHRDCDKWPQILDALHLRVLERGGVLPSADMKSLLNGIDKIAKSCDRKRGNKTLCNIQLEEWKKLYTKKAREASSLSSFLTN